MKKNIVLLAVAVAALLLLAAVIVPGALAQALVPGSVGAAQGSVQNGVYTWPDAGFSLTLPPLWLKEGYKWTESWGPNANGIQGARYINEWLYSPVAAGERPSALLTITVYDQAAWDAMAAQGGPLPSVAGRANGLVYTMRTPQGDPYPQGSADSQRFRDYSAALAPALSRITIQGTASQPSATTTSSTAFTKESLQNATYKIEGAPSGAVTLTNGEYRAPAAPGSASEFVVKLTDNVVVGTLNGQPAAAVVLTSSGGGSGTFYHLAIMVDQSGKPVNVATTLLGDRVKINGVSITNNQVVVDLVTHGPSDPMASPTLRQVWTYELRGGQLVKVS
ncbi:MAG: hypothetical protein U0822_02460 [Anaerolineae bacterium]